MRAGAHEDINAITLLLGAEEAGLQVLDRDGAGCRSSRRPAGVVCNIGDMLQRLTNHVLPSTTHRVVNPAPERRGVARYSTPFFLHFAPDYLIRPCPAASRPRGRTAIPSRSPPTTTWQQRLARDPPEVAGPRLTPTRPAPPAVRPSAGPRASSVREAGPF